MRASSDGRRCTRAQRLIRPIGLAPNLSASSDISGADRGAAAAERDRGVALDHSREPWPVATPPICARSTAPCTPPPRSTNTRTPLISAPDGNPPAGRTFRILGVFHLVVLYAWQITNSTPQKAPPPWQIHLRPHRPPILCSAVSQRSKEDFADNWVASNKWELPAGDQPPARRTCCRRRCTRTHSASQWATVQTSAGPPNTLFAIDPPSGQFLVPRHAARRLGRHPGHLYVRLLHARPPAQVSTPASCRCRRRRPPPWNSAHPRRSTRRSARWPRTRRCCSPTAPPMSGRSSIRRLEIRRRQSIWRWWRPDLPRPVLRWKTRAAWTPTGHDGNLTLQGLWLQGSDLVIAGTWDRVTFAALHL